MSRFDRYLLSQLMALFGFFSLVLVSVYWINQAVALFEQLIADGESALVFVELSALTLPNVIRLVLPVAGFAAALYVTNRLSQESELVVMQATGFSPWRLARPALAFGLIVALLLGVLSNFLVPAARGELADRRAEIAANVSARLLTDGNFQHPAPGLTLYIRQVAANGELEDLFLTDARAPDQRTTYTADRAFLVRDEGQPKLVMFDGMAQTLELATQRLSVTRFDDFTYDIGALVSQKPRTSRDLRELSTPRLLIAGADDLTLTGATKAEFTTEAHARIAQPLSAAVVALIGFAALLTGSFSRFGAWKQMATALGLMIFVQLLANVGTQLADQSDSAWPAVYLPVIGGGLSAVVLLWLAGRPRRIGRARPVAEAAE